MQRNCGEDVSSAVVDEWTGRVMQQHTLNMVWVLSPKPADYTVVEYKDEREVDLYM